MTTGRKILFRADGNHQIGLGHIYRVLVVGRALSEAGWHVGYVTLDGTLGERMLQEMGVPIFTARDRNAPYVSEDTLKAFDPNVVLLDVLDCEEGRLTDLKKLKSVRLITMDDTKAGLDFADVVINAFTAPHSTPSRIGSDTAIYDGPEYMILNHEATRFVGQDRHIAERANRLLLSYGGTDTHNVTERMLGVLNDVKVHFDIRINLGPGSEPTDKLEEAASESPHKVQVLRSSPSLIAEFVSADMVLCGGGVSLYELAAMGVPAAALATEPHEIDTIRYFASQGAVVDLGWEGDVDFAHAIATIAELAVDYFARRDMAERGPALVDGRGLERCVEIISGDLAL